MMRKIIALMAVLIFGLYISISAQALGTPIIVGGKIITSGTSGGIPVTIEHIETRVSVTVVTSASGEYSYDWYGGTTKADYSNVKIGDNFKFTVSGKTATRTYGGEAMIAYFDFIDTGLLCPTCPTTECATCQTCQTCQTCVPETVEKIVYVTNTTEKEVTKYVCSDGLVMDSKDDCSEPTPLSDQELINRLLEILAGAGVAGAAVTLTLSKTAQHYHRGIKNKHSIYTMHLNSQIRHKFGEIAPIYKKKTDGSYYYVGSDA